MINLIEILKDCPKGRKLYSPLYGEVAIDHVTDRTIYAIYLDCGDDLAKFNSEGQVWSYETGECMLFPSSIEKSWNCWQPVLFEKGDIIHMNDRHSITYLYDCYDVDGYYGFNEGNFRVLLNIEDYRFATEEESQQFLKNMEEKGFKWNEETNQVEKIETPTNRPKFNVDDWIVNAGRSIRKIVGIDTSIYDYLTIKDYEDITENLPIEHADEYYHLWTIEDAKRGDILVGECPGDKVILLYSGNLLEDTNSPDYTCILNDCGLEVVNEHTSFKWRLSRETTIRPATVNERIELQEAIKNNGYEVTLDNRVVKSSVVEEITHPEPIKLYNKENLAKELETIFNNYGIDTRLNMRDYLIADHIIKYIDNLEELLKQQI